MSRKSSTVKEDPPKRPLSAYFLFLADQRAQIVKDNPEAKIAEVSQIAGQLWKSIDAAKKTEYEAKQAELKKKYDTEKAAYEAKYGPIKSNKKKSQDQEATKKITKKKK